MSFDPGADVFKATIVRLGPATALVEHGKPMAGPQHSIVVRRLSDVKERWREESGEGAHAPDPARVVYTWLTVVGDMEGVVTSPWPMAGRVKEAAVYALGPDGRHHLVEPGSFSLDARRRAMARAGGYALRISLPVRGGARAHGYMVNSFATDPAGGSHPACFCGLYPVVGPPDHMVVSFYEC